MRDCETVRVREWENERVSEKVFRFPAFVWHSDIFQNKHPKDPTMQILQVLQDILGSQLLSDIQTFLAGNQLYDIQSNRWGCCWGWGKKMSERQTKAGNQITLSLTVSHSLTLVILNNFYFHVYAPKSLSHSHTISLSQCLTLTLSLSHSLTLHMLNNFCFHVYAQKSLSHSLILSFTLSRHAEQLLFSCLGSKVAVNSRKLQCFFLPQPHPLLLL